MLPSKDKDKNFKLIDDLTQSLSSVVTQKIVKAVRKKPTFSYLDINSKFRNRRLYPEPSNFVIPFTNGSSSSYNTTISSSQDPVSSSAPYYFFDTLAGSTTTVINLDIPESVPSTVFNNEFINFYLQYFLTGEFRKIIFSNSVTDTVTVDSPFSVAPTAGSVMILRYSLPMIVCIGKCLDYYRMELFSVWSDISNVDNFYKNMFFTLYDNGLNYFNIISYDGTTHIITLDKAMPADMIINGFYYIEVNNFVYDNAVNLRYSGSLTLNQPACYNIQLLQLTVPMRYIVTKNILGTLLINYPFLYIHFYNEPSSVYETLYGNDPPGASATFKVLIDVNTIPSWKNNDELYATPYLVFNNIAQSAPQIMKFTPNQSLRFKVTLPDGEIIKYENAISTSTVIIPSNYYQISALIAFRKI